MRFGLVSPTSVRSPSRRPSGVGGAGRGFRLGGAAPVGSPRVGLGRPRRRSVGHAERGRRPDRRLLLGTASRRCPAGGRKCLRVRWRSRRALWWPRRLRRRHRREPPRVRGVRGELRQGAALAAAGGRSRADPRSLGAGPLGPREIPIWIGGNSTRARHLAARYDGWLPDSTTPEEMRMSPEDVRDETWRIAPSWAIRRPASARSTTRMPTPARRGGSRACTTAAARSKSCWRACAPGLRLGAVSVDVLARAGLRACSDSWRRRLRRGPPGPQRADRPPPGCDRPLPERSRRRRGRPVRPSQRARHQRPRRRPQRGRPRGRRRRRDDRPRRDEGRHVDPEARTVRAEGGLTWAELNGATAEHGLAVTGGAISTTGIAGLRSAAASAG